MPVSLEHPDTFVRRHVAPDDRDIAEMLRVTGKSSLDELIEQTIPSTIRLRRPLALPAALSERDLLDKLSEIANKNEIWRSFLGMGYSDCITPPVIQRNVLENPGWYTQYTPYQAEISQGRLEALLNFQTMVSDLTALEIANASLLDEASAAAEAMHMMESSSSADDRHAIFLSDGCHPQTIEVLRTRAAAHGIEVIVGDAARAFDSDHKLFGVILQYPRTDGALDDWRALIARAHASGVMVAMACDLLALALIVPPGRARRGHRLRERAALRRAARIRRPARGVLRVQGGARSQAPRAHHRRQRRRAGRPRAAHGAPDARAAHPPREGDQQRLHRAGAPRGRREHVRRLPRAERASARSRSACTAWPPRFAHGLRALGVSRRPRPLLRHRPRSRARPPRFRRSLDGARARKMNLRRIDERSIGVALDEITSPAEVDALLASSAAAPRRRNARSSRARRHPPSLASSAASAYLTHAVFTTHHSETEMLRYMRMLESRDLSLAHSMIPLGSCTMKLNATAEMMPITWSHFNRIHPFVPLEQAEGYQIIIKQLEAMLGEITGFPAVSLQPNSGAQGELAGLLVIRKAPREPGREASRHLPHPGERARDEPGLGRDGGDARRRRRVRREGVHRSRRTSRPRRRTHAKELAALMVTYPSTYGVFEEEIERICAIVHEHGGQVYLDGANLNAQVGLCRPADVGADVCHVNLHKTFCIPHGGGGPGMGPIGVAQHLAKFLPSHPVVAGRAARGSTRPGQRGAVGQREHPAHLVGVHRDDGARRA